MKVFFLTFLIFGSIILNAQNTAVQNYIEQWSPVAVEQMQTHKIPASITLAQGVLESGYGTSYLAKEGNNHFGIKCHDWNGKKIFHDDDKKNECFRKYKDAKSSYNDHSLFLTSRDRYAFLFDLDIMDYKAWAHGLKKAGYATNPKYPSLLIDLIEKYDLTQYDNLYVKGNEELMASNELGKNKSPFIERKPNAVVKHTTQLTLSPVYKNRTAYVVATGNETLLQIAQHFELTLRQIHKYNDFPNNQDYLNEGDLVYIMPKKRRIKSNMKNQITNSQVELWEISQREGVRLKSLEQYVVKNNIKINPVLVQK